ncbi:hypothetical protein [Marivirga harenae]|uniref:hypothetical protein n=1 Tax=Marivirga harenae TaxID=2010992 RepID=UPI0026DFD00F|nr:hypothetical protein [Marivirga harenae]WKV10769.1 hypothetical protein Q3Y49_11150 [Marivirga harenae]
MMNKLYTLIIKATYFYVAFINIGCTSNSLDSEFLVSKRINYSDSLYISLKDSVTFSIPNNIPSELFFFTLQGSQLYGLSFINPYSIYTLDLNDGEVDEFFKLEPEHQHFKIKQYFINDTIVAVISEFGEIMEFNLQTDSYEYFRVKDETGYPSTHGFVTPFLRVPPNLYLIENSYYFNVYPLGYFDNYSESEKLESPLLASINRESQNLSFKLVPTGIMDKIQSTYYPYDLSFPYLTYLKNSFFISYPMSHQIFKYDTSFQILDQFQISPSRRVKLPKPMEFKKILDERYLQEYRMKTPYYSKINYHSDINVMSRVFYSQNSINTVNGKYEIKYGDINIIFFNDKGIILKEFKLDRNKDLLAVESNSNELIILKRKKENELQAIKYNIEFINN